MNIMNNEGKTALKLAQEYAEFGSKEQKFLRQF